MEDGLRILCEETVKCINCGELSFKVSLYIYRAPIVGDILLEHGRCNSCGFSKSDVSVLNYGNPKTIRVRIESVNDLRAVVVKSASASISIPELGIEVMPGPAAYGYITTVEGILERVLDVIPSDCINDVECTRKVNRIRDAMDGKEKFTLIIRDPLGRSTVIGEGLNIVIEEGITY